MMKGGSPPSPSKQALAPTYTDQAFYKHMIYTIYIPSYLHGAPRIAHRRRGRLKTGDAA